MTIDLIFSIRICFMNSWLILTLIKKWSFDETTTTMFQMSAAKMLMQIIVETKNSKATTTCMKNSFRNLTINMLFSEYTFRFRIVHWIIVFLIMRDFWLTELLKFDQFVAKLTILIDVTWIESRCKWYIIENKKHFVWRNDRILWNQLRNRKYEFDANRFREHTLMKISRIWNFRALTNRLALIDCRFEVKNDSNLMKKKNAWKRCAFLDV